MEQLPKKVHKYNIFTSVKYAWAGITYNFAREANLSIQLTIGLIFSGLGLFTGHFILAMTNLILMGLVMSLEMLNTAFENLCDLVEPKYNLQVKVIKDTAAGAILMISLIWLVVIFYQIFIIFVLQDNSRSFRI